MVLTVFLGSSFPSSIWHYSHINDLHSQKTPCASSLLQLWQCVIPLRHVNPANSWRPSTYVKPFEIPLLVSPPLFLLSLYFVYFLGTILTELMHISLFPTFKFELPKSWQRNFGILSNFQSIWFLVGACYELNCIPPKYMLKTQFLVPHNVIFIWR